MATQTTKKKFDWKYIIPILCLGAAIYSAIRGFMSAHSGSTNPTPDGSTGADSTINVGYFHTGGGIFSICFLVAAIVIYLLMRNEDK